MKTVLIVTKMILNEAKTVLREKATEQQVEKVLRYVGMRALALMRQRRNRKETETKTQTGLGNHNERN